MGPIAKERRGLLVEAAILSALCLAVGAYGLSLVGDYRIDDAYITFSYSRNLAEGKGPIYGHDMRVEGYSNFLWMVLCSVGELLSVDPLAFARVLSVGFFGLILASVWWAARRFSGPVAALLVTLCLATSSDFHRAIQSGLETVAFCGFIAAGLCHYIVESKESRRWSLLWFTGAALTRIDGIVPLAAMGGLEVARWILAGRRERLMPLVRWLAIGVAPVAVYWLWRASYYGLLFPLTYYAKASLAADMEYRGAAYVWTGLQDSGLWILLLLSAFGLGRKAPKEAWVLVAFVLGMTGYVVHVGGDWMPFNRMLLPVYTPLFIVGSLSLSPFLADWSSLRRPSEGVIGGALVLALGWCALFLSQVSIDTPFEKQKIAEAQHHLTHTRNLLEAKPFVDAIVRQPGDRLVTDYGGVFAYDTEATVIEMWGLANRDIALKGNTEGVVAIYGKTCVPCYADFQPDYFHSIVPLLRGPKDFRSKRQLIHQIFQGPAIDRVISLQKNYRVGRVRDPKTKKTLWFLERMRPEVKFEKRQVGGLIVDYPPLR